MYDPRVIGWHGGCIEQGMTKTNRTDDTPETRTDDCDGCDERREGVSQYQAGAVVLHVCHGCGGTEPAEG